MESKLPSGSKETLALLAPNYANSAALESKFSCVTDAIGNLLFPGYWSMKTVLPPKRARRFWLRDEKRERNETSDFDISEDKKVRLGNARAAPCGAADKGEERRRTIEKGNKTASYLQLWHRQDCFSPQWPQIIKYQEHPNSRSSITAPCHIYRKEYISLAWSKRAMELV